MTYELYGVLQQMCVVLLYFVDISHSFYKQGARYCFIPTTLRPGGHSYGCIESAAWAELIVIDRL